MNYVICAASAIHLDNPAVALRVVDEFIIGLPKSFDGKGTPESKSEVLLKDLLFELLRGDPHWDLMGSGEMKCWGIKATTNTPVIKGQGRYHAS
ncbi:hypothetical protein E2542_SST13540 [Spatholobus suberectus]|nr:hypothetical protein E2542_SST13540 [Spatholobus suberectus]